MDINVEIECLTKRLAELESQKQIKEEDNKRVDVNGNLKTLKKAIDMRSEQVHKNNYSKSCIVAKFIDRDMIEPLQSIYNLLQTLNERIYKLETQIAEHK